MGAAESKTEPDPRNTSTDSYDGLDFYEILCISRDATDEDIKRAYYKRAKSTHPDKDSTPGAKERFQKLNEAYETLRTLDGRSMYDIKLETERNASTETESDSRGFKADGTMPGQWGDQKAPNHAPGWFEWLFSGFTPTVDSFSRYEPAAYINRNRHAPRPQGMSAKEIYEHLTLCVDKATWKGNGQDPSLFTLLRNLFECIAYDEKRWGSHQPIPVFGSMSSMWCREDGHAQHYAQDFYTFWLNFETLKPFDWVNPYYTLSDDPALLRKVEKENRKIHKVVKDQYNDVIQSIVEALLLGDPRIVQHLILKHFAGGQPLPSIEQFCSRFIRQRRHKRKGHREESQPQNTREPQNPNVPENTSVPRRTQTKKQRKKQKQRDKAKKKGSW